MKRLLTPPTQAIIYEDDKLYVCLASHAITSGHTVVVWKHDVKDINALPCEEYEYLMNIVDVTRGALRTVLNIEKVYLVYMDEIEQVHWHLVPRYDEKGFNVFNHVPQDVTDFSFAGQLKEAFKEEIKKHSEFN